MSSKSSGVLLPPPTTLPVVCASPVKAHNARVLPSPTSDAWSDPRTVFALAGLDQAVVDYWATVSPAAHGMGHPDPFPGCPGCGLAHVPAESDRGAEIVAWRRAVA